MTYGGRGDEYEAFDRPDVAAAGLVPKTDPTTPMPRSAWSSPSIAVASGC